MSKDEERYDVSQYDDVLELWGYDEPTDEQEQLIERLLSDAPEILDALKKAYKEIDRTKKLWESLHQEIDLCPECGEEGFWITRDTECVRCGNAS